MFSFFNFKFKLDLLYLNFNYHKRYLTYLQVIINKRSALANLSKGIIVLLIIQVHILELSATPQMFSSSKGSFLLFLGGSLITPIFAVVFGYFIAKSKLTTTQTTLVREIKLFFVGVKIYHY